MRTPLSLRSISEQMGVPPQDRQRLCELSHALINDQDPEVATTPEASLEASAEILGYANEMAARERANPSDGLTSILLEAEVEGRKLTALSSPCSPSSGRILCLAGL